LCRTSKKVGIKSTKPYNCILLHCRNSTCFQILEFDSEASILLISATSVVKEASGVVRLTKTLEDFLVVERPLKSFKEVHQSVRVLQDKVTHLDVTARVSKSARTLAPTHSKSAFYSLLRGRRSWGPRVEVDFTMGSCVCVWARSPTRSSPTMNASSPSATPKASNNSSKE
jgi:hypothetical protein